VPSPAAASPAASPGPFPGLKPLSKSANPPPPPLSASKGVSAAAAAPAAPTAEVASQAEAGLRRMTLAASGDLRQSQCSQRSPLTLPLKSWGPFSRTPPPPSPRCAHLTQTVAAVAAPSSAF
jgi:hypothetical protein